MYVLLSKKGKKHILRVKVLLEFFPCMLNFVIMNVWYSKKKQKV